MAITARKDNMTGVAHKATGYLKGTYTAATVANADAGSVVSEGVTLASGVMTIKLGFAPKHFKIINTTDRLIQEWFDGMNSGDYLEEVAAGDKTVETDDKIVVSGSTVTVTFDSGIATDNDTVVWEATA